MWNPPRVTWRELLRRTARQCMEDRILDQAATLAFYFLLSIFPLLLFLIALLGMFLRSGDGLRETLHAYLSTLVPATASSLVDNTLAQITSGSGALRLSIALVFTWWSACQGMLALVQGLNVAYETRESRPWWRQYLLASGLTLFLLLLVAGGVLALIEGERAAMALVHLTGQRTLVVAIWRALQIVLTLALALTAFNVVYRRAPNLERPRWNWLMPGTLLGVALWVAVSFGFKLYLTFFDNFSLIYGSIGAVIVLLLWFSLSGMAILVGGEFNSEIEKAAAAPVGSPEKDQRSGTRSHATVASGRERGEQFGAGRRRGSTVDR
jgi:membrane protein